MLYGNALCLSAWLVTVRAQPSINDHYEPEMTLAMQLAMFLLAMWPNGTTYGLQLMSLKYRDERRSTVTKDAPVTAVQKVLWALLHFAVPYAIVRVNRWLLTGREQEEDDGQDEWKLRMWNNLQRLETAYSALSLVNFLVFLIDGRYKSTKCTMYVLFNCFFKGIVLWWIACY